MLRVTSGRATETPLATPMNHLRDTNDDHRVLIGCTLPPKVAGVPRGAVLLSVPHVSPSTTVDAAADRAGVSDAIAPLPLAPLVRVRWWGEDRPGSTLFRPTRLALEHKDSEREAKREETDEEESEDEDSSGSSIRMRYPVCVPLEQLIGYLRDMKELVFDVVDRFTRKKIGHSVFSFQLDTFSDMTATANESAKNLRRTNALCEIHSTADATIVLGYLTVNFEIEWTALANVATPLKWANSVSRIPTITVNPRRTRSVQEREPERQIQQRLSFSSISSSSTTSGVYPHASWRQRHPSPLATQAEGSDIHLGMATDVKSDRLGDLLEKGRALELSMSKAVKEEATVKTATVPAGDVAKSVPSPTSMMMLMAPYEAMTEELDASWERVLEEADTIQPSTKNRDSVDPVEAARQHTDVVSASLGGLNALEISFESMELELAMMDRLRKLREGSISTRFSPIQLVVSHEHPQCILHQANASKREHWIAAFAVNSSLRKRQWRTNYAHTLPLLLPGSQSNGQAQRIQVNQRVLRFRVRCKPQHASPLGSRKRGVIPSIDLSAEVAVEELLDHRDREWVLSLALHIAPDGAKSKTKDGPITRRTVPVGRITVKFRFCELPEITEEESDRLSDEVASSQWSLVEQNHNQSKRHHCHHPVRALDHHMAPLRQIITESHRNRWSKLGSPVFFGLLIDRALVRYSSDLHPKEPTKTTRVSLRIEYGTPAFFGSSAKALRLKRSTKASLHRIANNRLQANLRHMNAFPLDVSNEFVHKLERGLLILEVWIQEQSKTLTSYVTEKLLGVVKIPLHAFVACARNVETINRYLSHLTPFVAVDSDSPIIDPLTGHANGHVHVRMAFGSAEQMFNLKSTLAAVVKLQSLARMWLVRRAIGYWKRFELTRFSDDHDEVGADDSNSARTIEADEHTPNESTGTIADSLDSSSERMNGTHDHLRQRIVRVEIRVEIRNNYVPRHKSSSAFIGCEIYGHLRFNSESNDPTGPRFTLWWDANDVQLNSHFVHTLQAASPVTGILLHDVILLFRLQPQPAVGMQRSQGKSTTSNFTGTAAIDLASVVMDTQGSLEDIDKTASGAVQLLEEVDLPIEWESTNASTHAQRFPERLPVRIGMRIVHGESDEVEPHLPNGIVEDDERARHDHHHTEQVTSVETLSRIERLLPASLHICLDIQRIADVKDMIQERLAVVSHRVDEEHAVRTLGRAVDQGSLTVAIAMSLCLGMELHPDENGLNTDNGTVFQDDRGRWHKQFQFEGIQLKVSNGVQVFPSITQGDVRVLVHPALVASFQEESLAVEIIVSDDDGDVSIGAVFVPLSAMLFRPSGVQGSFPVRVDNGLAGRIGVHLYIDQDDAPSCTALSASASSEKKKHERQLLDQEFSSPRSDSSSSLPELVSEGSCEQTLEQAVASVHEAALQIQHRLARLTTRSTPSESDELDSDRALTTDERDDSVATASDASPTPPLIISTAIERPPTEDQWLHAHSHHDKEVGDTKAELASENEQVEEEIDAGVHERSESDGESVVGSEMGDEGVFTPFEPITLASLGIDELELSPITEANLPSFLLDDNLSETSRNADANESTLDKSDTSESSPVREAEDDSVADMDDDVENEGDEPTSDSNDLFDANSAESGESEDRGMVNDMGSDGHGSPSHQSEHSSTRESRLNAGAYCGGAAVVKVDERLDDSMNDVDDLEFVSTKPTDTRSLSLPPPGSTVEESGTGSNHGTRQLEDGPVVSRDSFLTDTDENASEHGEEATDGKVLERTDLSRGDRHELDEDSQSGDNTKDDAIDRSDNATPDDLNRSRAETIAFEEASDDGSLVDVTEGPVVPTQNERRLHQVGALRCDSFTQTHRDDVDTATEVSLSHGLLPAARGVQTEGLPYVVDSGCQTVAADFRLLDEDNKATSLAHTELVVGEETDSETQQEAEKRTAAVVDRVVVMDHPPDCSSIDFDASSSSSHINDVHRALPAEKFEIAWQLLNEIRALYVGPDGPKPLLAGPSSPPEPVAGILTAQHLLTVEDPVATVAAAPSVDHTPRSLSPQHGPQHASVTQSKNDDTSTRVYATNGSVEVPMSASRHSWQWRDAASLRAEVKERLQVSKHEYEEALAMSQSIHSMHSWSNVSTKQELTAEWEEKAQALSASALSARTSSVRTRTLFRVDTETERIARIMQGSLRNWLHETDDDDRDDDSTTTDDDRNLMDNYF